MPNLYLKLKEKDLILTKSLLHDSGIIYLNHLIFIMAKKREHSQIPDGKTEAHRTYRTCRGSKLLEAKPKNWKSTSIVDICGATAK